MGGIVDRFAYFGKSFKYLKAFTLTLFLDVLKSGNFQITVRNEANGRPLMWKYSCGSDDDDLETDGDGNVSLVGNYYQYDDESYNDYGEKSEYHKSIEFLSSTRCEVHSWGFDLDEGEKNRFNETLTLSYSVSGKKVTIRGWKWNFGMEELELTVDGKHLRGSGYDFVKKG